MTIQSKANLEPIQKLNSSNQKMSQTFTGPSPKSEINKKRQNLHKARMTEQRDRVRKTVRLQKICVDIYQHDMTQFEYILKMDDQDVFMKLKEVLDNKDFLTFLYLLRVLERRPDFSEFLSEDVLRYFAKVTIDEIGRPEVMLNYGVLSQSYNYLYKVVTEFPEIIKSIVKQIKTLKGSVYQERYLNFLEQVGSNYSKRKDFPIGDLFDTIAQLLEHDTIGIETGVRVLKSMIDQLNPEKQFSDSVIERIIECYESQKGNHQNLNSVMFDCFIVLNRISYCQERIGIITIYRLIQTFLHSKCYLPLKLVEQFYNIDQVIQKLIKKIATYEVEQLKANDSKKIINALVQQLDFEYFEMQVMHYQITTLVIHNLLSTSKLFLKEKIFDVPYLTLIQSFAQFCSPQVLLFHFIEYDFLNFLVDCIDHSNSEIQIIALEIIRKMISTYDIECTNKVLAGFQIHANLKEMLEIKFYKSQNKDISKRIQFILDVFESFKSR